MPKPKETASQGTSRPGPTSASAQAARRRAAPPAKPPRLSGQTHAGSPAPHVAVRPRTLLRNSTIARFPPEPAAKLATAPHVTRDERSPAGTTKRYGRAEISCSLERAGRGPAQCARGRAGRVRAECAGPVRNGHLDLPDGGGGRQSQRPAVRVLRAVDLAGEQVPPGCRRADDAQRRACARRRAVHAAHRVRTRPA